MTSPRERVLTALKRNGTPDRTPFEISWGAFTPLLMKTYREKTGSELPPEEYFDFDTRSVFPGPTRLKTDFTRFFPDGVEPEASFDEWGIGSVPTLYEIPDFKYHPLGTPQQSLKSTPIRGPISMPPTATKGSGRRSQLSTSAAMPSAARCTKPCSKRHG